MFLIAIWPSWDLGLVTNKKKTTKNNNKSCAEQELRSAHGRAVNKFFFHQQIFDA